MNELVTLSRHKLETFLTCQRRFQLRYLKRIPWPVSPKGEQAEAALARGQQFHQLLERHFLGFPVAAEAIEETRLQSWWLRFVGSGLVLPEGQRLPEIALTIPAGDYLLTGRFDLLIVGGEGSQPFAHVFDWKTGQARSIADLRQDWQTRLYLAMLAEGGKAFTRDGRAFSPEHMAITYWYVTEPDSPRTIRYTPSWHAQNWAEIQGSLGEMSRKRGDETWPLTEDWSQCRPCAYQPYCERRQAGQMDEEMPDDEGSAVDIDLQLAPQLP
jgi:hypothetical protein